MITTTPASASLAEGAGGRLLWHSDVVLNIVAAEERAWTDIPGVWVIGLIIGVVIVAAAIRHMIKK